MSKNKQQFHEQLELFYDLQYRHVNYNINGFQE